jgi:hypothetical protein
VPVTMASPSRRHSVRVPAPRCVSWSAACAASRAVGAG